MKILVGDGKKVSYTEYVSGKGPGASPVFAFATDRSRCTRIVDILWTSLWQGAQDFLGYPKVVTAGGGTKYIRRIIPDGVTSIGTAIPPKTFLWCTEITEVRGVGLPDAVAGTIDMVDGAGLNFIAKYKFARMTLVYNTTTYEVMSDVDMNASGFAFGGGPDESKLVRYVTQRVRPAAQYTGFPRGVMKFVTGLRAGDPIEGQPGFILPKNEVSFTWHQIPYDGVPSPIYNPNIPVGTGNIDDTIGRVNDATFGTWDILTGAYKGFEQGTLLLTGVDATPHVSPFGDRVYDLEYHCLHDPIGHNYVLGLDVAGDTDYIELTVDGATHPETSANDGKHIYDAHNYKLLFRPQ